MRQCHLQVSEMLRRLALSFLQSKGQQQHQHLKVIGQLNSDLQLQSSQLGNQLSTAYDYFSAWKVRKSSSPPPTTITTGRSNLELALNSLERHLSATSLLIESGDNINDLRVQLSHEFKSIATCWELVELELDKSKAPPAQPTALATSILQPSSIPIKGDAAAEKCSTPLYGAWEPQVEDLEILEADLMQEKSIHHAAAAGLIDDDDDLFGASRETREERLARKRLMAAQSKLLYSELQVVLQSKAAEWKEREDKVMQRLGISAAQSPPPIPTPRPVQVEPPIAMNKFIPFNLQSSLAAQVRALASQRETNEDVIGDDDDSSSSSSNRGE